MANITATDLMEFLTNRLEDGKITVAQFKKYQNDYFYPLAFKKPNAETRAMDFLKNFGKTIKQATTVAPAPAPIVETLAEVKATLASLLNNISQKKLMTPQELNKIWHSVYYKKPADKDAILNEINKLEKILKEHAQTYYTASVVMFGESLLANAEDLKNPEKFEEKKKRK